MELFGDGDAVQARHLEVQDGDVGVVPAGHRDGLGAGRGLRDHVQVVLQAEQGGQGGADEVLVVGEQQPDHGAGSRAAAVVLLVVVGSRASTVNQPPGSGPAVRCPPEALTRSRSPARPCPGAWNGSGGGAPSLWIRRTAVSDAAGLGVGVDAEFDGAGGGVAVPDDVGGGLPQHPREGGLGVGGEAGAVPDDPGGDPGRAEHRSGAGEFGVQVRGPVPGDDFPYFAGGFVGEAADLQHFVDGVGVAAAGEPGGEVAGDRDQGEVAAQDVVEVPGEPQPLLRDRQPGLHGPGCVELPDQHQHPFLDAMNDDEKPDQERIEQAQPHRPRPVVVAREGVPTYGDRGADPDAGVERPPAQHRRQRRGLGSTKQQDNDEHDHRQLVRGGSGNAHQPVNTPATVSPDSGDDQRSARRWAAEQGAEPGAEQREARNGVGHQEHEERGQSDRPRPGWP